MEQQQRQFKGVWIPKEIWESEDLTIHEKVMLVEIDSLDDDEKGCWASNKYFSDFFKLTPQRVSQIINILKDKGYIKINIERNGKEITCRHLKINRPPYPEVSNIFNGVSNKFDRGIKYIKEGYQENFKENNIYLNNIYLNNTNNNKDIVEKLDSIPYEEIIDYLNNSTGSNYKSSTNKTKSLIKARFNEGFKLEDFKVVISKMTREWLNDNKMKNYLRPETLFGTKFESYLNRTEKELTTKDVVKNIDVDELMKGWFE